MSPTVGDRPQGEELWSNGEAGPSSMLRLRGLGCEGTNGTQSTLQNGLCPSGAEVDRLTTVRNKKPWRARPRGLNSEEGPSAPRFNNLQGSIFNFISSNSCRLRRRRIDLRGDATGLLACGLLLSTFQDRCLDCNLTAALAPSIESFSRQWNTRLAAFEERLPV